MAVKKLKCFFQHGFNVIASGDLSKQSTTQSVNPQVTDFYTK